MSRHAHIKGFLKEENVSNNKNTITIGGKEYSINLKEVETDHLIMKRTGSGTIEFQVFFNKEENDLTNILKIAHEKMVKDELEKNIKNFILELDSLSARERYFFFENNKELINNLTERVIAGRGNQKEQNNI